LGSQRNGLSHTQQLIVLQDMTRRLGVIHEAQTLQIKLWPVAVDPGLVGSDCRLDVDGKRMVYVWVDPKKPHDWKPRGAYLKRLQHLANSVKRFLFGADWYFEVQMNGATIYTSAAGVVDEIPQSSRGASRARAVKRDRKSARKRSTGARRKQRRR
jgi:hypothetical protein